jgi:hypothetical protein
MLQGSPGEFLLQLRFDILNRNTRVRLADNRQQGFNFLLWYLFRHGLLLRD